ncbi:sporulation protein YpjB [Aquibacillus albus]|uniref:Sporulation protein YpjB n=1 Tax=Aquibacillus albus TaxID=1168171 RepID=A0ABS2MVB3_9BACI|nr:sporulation protein YpjB [Aquibacillus albus]MBM7569842.1 sporulation protein YpjB [Aquibacillus albus]
MIGISTFTIPVYGNHSHVSSTLYQYERFVEDGRYTSAYNLLQNHKEALAQLFKNETPDSSDELISLLDKNLAMIQDSSIKKTNKLSNALSLVFAVDSIIHPHDPAWLSWKKNLEDRIITYSNQTEISNKQLEQINSDWKIINPALRISLAEENYERLESTFESFKQNPNQDVNAQEFVTVFRETSILDVSNTNQKEDSTSFLWLIFVVGGVIMITLSYVGWKKYKGEKNKSQKQTTN